MEQTDETSRLLADLDNPDENIRARAAAGLHRLGDPRALEACLQTLNDAPDLLHADHTPSVQCLIEIGAPAISPLLDLLGSDNVDSRMHAERALQGITRRLSGFDGSEWRADAMEQWMDWWSNIGLDIAAAPGERAGAIERLRAAIKNIHTE